MVIWGLIAVGALVVVGVIAVAVLILRTSRPGQGGVQDERRPEGYWISVGTSLGVPLGAAMGLAFDNLALGMGMGIAIGVAIGAGLEQRNKENLRPLTEDEMRARRWALGVGLVALLILALAGVVVFLLIRGA